MVGAFIGDLAAWTYEHEPDVFEHYLVSDDAMPSGFMINMTCASELLLNLRSWGYKTPESYQSFFQNDDAIAILLQAITVAWVFHSDKVTQKVLQSYVRFHNQDEQVCSSLLAKVIYAMRNRATKEEALQLEFNEKPIHNYIEESKSENSLCGSFARAWAVFQEAEDFGKAIELAMTLPGERHLNAILVGSIADSMYDCKYFHPEDEGSFCGLPISWEKTSMCVTKNILKMHSEGRSFRGKNGVSIHLPHSGWRAGTNPLDGVRFTERQVESILMSHPFYYDNGWVYITEPYVICKFNLLKEKEYLYKIGECKININESSLVAEQAFLKAFDYYVNPTWEKEEGERWLEKHLQDDLDDDTAF